MKDFVKHKIRHVLFVSIAILLVLASSVASSNTGLPADTIAEIDHIVETARAEQKLPAVSVAIEVKGRIIFQKAYGLADLENDLRATPETLIRTGSVAKPM